METLVQDLLTPIIVEKSTKTRPISKTPWIVRGLRIYHKLVGPILPKIVATQALRLFGKPQKRYHRKPKAAVMQKAQSVTVQGNEWNLQTYIWENDGPTVLLVHGWETGGLHLFSFIEPLWSLGFRIIAMDGPAHGASDGLRTDLPDFANAINHVCQRLGTVHHIIAHSFGGAASSYMVATTDIKLQKLVLMSVPNKLVRIIEDFASYLSIPPTVLRNMHRIILEEFKVNPHDMEISSVGEKMDVNEVLVVHDRGDEVVPFLNAQEITDGLPQACLLPCENLGHNRILKNPQVTTRVAQFLKDDLKH